MVCDDQWANPPMSCNVYEGQKGCVIPFGSHCISYLEYFNLIIILSSSFSVEVSTMTLQVQIQQEGPT